MSGQLPGQLELFPAGGMHVTEVFSFVLPWWSEHGRERDKDQLWWGWRCSCGDSSEAHSSMASHEQGGYDMASLHAENAA